MEELEYLLKQVVRNQPSLHQVVLSTDQFTAISELVTQVCDIARTRMETCVTLAKQVKQKAAEIDSLNKDCDLLTQHMDKWKANLQETMAAVRKEVQTESAIGERWIKELRREREKNDYLEGALRDYSSKVAGLRAEASVNEQQIARLGREKDMLAANFKRAEATIEGLLDKCRDLRDASDLQKSEFQRIKVVLEMELEAEKQNRSKDAKAAITENKDLLERLKEYENTAKRWGVEVGPMKESLKEKTDLLDKKEKEIHKLSTDLQKLKETNKKLQEENQKLKKEVQTKEKGRNSSKDRYNELTDINSKLKAEVEGLKGQLEVLKDTKKDNSENQGKPKNKSVDRMAEDVEHTLIELKSKYSLVTDLLKKGTSTKYKEKNQLLKDMFSLSNSNLAKIKKSYLELLTIADSQSKAMKQPAEEANEPPQQTMDIEKPEPKKRDKSKKTMTPEKQPQVYDRILPDEDTAYKPPQDCGHRDYKLGCAYCQLMKPDSKMRPPLGSFKSKKGG